MKPANAKLDVLQQIVSLARVCISYCSTEQLHNHNLILRNFLLMTKILNTNPFQKNFAWPGVFHTLSGSIASHTFSTSKSSASGREIGHKKPFIFGFSEFSAPGLQSFGLGWYWPPEPACTMPLKEAPAVAWKPKNPKEKIPGILPSFNWQKNPRGKPQLSFAHPALQIRSLELQSHRQRAFGPGAVEKNATGTSARCGHRWLRCN